MITFVYGAPGSGKTYRIFEELKNNCTNAFLIVPEQQAVSVERRSLDTLPPSAQLSFEVLNFKRLCNKVARIYGGLSYHYITPAMKSLLMWRTLRELSPLLNEYGSVGNELALTDVMLRAVDELSNSSITPTELENASKKLSNEGLCKKLSDIALITAAYRNIVAESFDDEADDLFKLSNTLSKHRFFNGYNVYIDGFSSFTSPEYSIIEKIFAQADNVTVTLACESESCGHLCCESICKTAKRLNTLAEKLGKSTRSVYLTDNKRTNNREIATLNAEFWNNSSSGIQDIPESERGNIKILLCHDIYEEATAAVSAVEKEIRNGIRYRDIAVVARNAETYNGIIDAAFEASGIPYFMSEKTDISSYPAITLILSALRIKYLGFRREDVLTHAKTGMYDIPSRSIDMFEEYVNTWSISGKRFTDGVFNMNPDGYTSTCSERGNAILAAANEVRQLITDKLCPFFCKLDAAENVREMCSALYDYMVDCNIAESLAKTAEKLNAEGDKRAASDTVAVYNTLISFLDDLVYASGDEKLTVEEFYRAWLLCVKTASVGSIPTGYDVVTVGSASLLRSDNVKVAIVLGLNEGEFPANVRDNGVFTDSDRKALTDLGVELGSDSAARSAEELLYLRRVLALPAEKLYLLYAAVSINGGDSKLRPSMPVNRICKLFNYIKPELFASKDPFDAVFSENDARERLPLLTGSYRDAVLSELKDYKEMPVSVPECSVDAETAKKLFGNRIYLSQSKTDSFVKCRFGYYCNSILKLRSEEKAKINYAVSGGFIHEVLEKFMKKAVSEGDLDMSDPEETVDEVISEIVNELGIENMANSNRLQHLFLRLRRLSLLLIESIRTELLQSSFRPVFFEQGIGKDGGIEPIVLTLQDGSTVCMTGIVDRIDLWINNGQVYVRVVDYKTGKKEFSLEDIKNGLNIQLVVYLMTLCRSKSFAKLAGCSDGELALPAGANYLSARIASKAYSCLPDPQTVLADAESSLSRSGFSLADDVITEALGKKKITQKRFSPEEFKDFQIQIENTIIGIAETMKSGNADAEPLADGRSLPCDHCEMSAVCRLKV